ncbi:MAG TPA: hypothetical protein DGM69_09430 [Chloroflexi bacterium]|nr:hypothetical protein [Chloroflexota bacterium]|tara:strand:- start:694 stop:3105 length:2412 start_codon:yes stop_codon:yes gene_type:complete
MAEAKTSLTWSLVDRTTAWVLFGVLFISYWLTTSLTFISADELFLFDTSESFARRGSVMRNMTADLDWPGHTYVEPVQSLFSVPFVWIADRFSNVGVAHSVLLLNMLVTAVSGVVLYMYVRWLGYRRIVATWITLLYGFTTMAWPYTKNYFREPLAGLTLLLCAYGLLRWRIALHNSDRIPHRWLVFAVVSGFLSIMVKESGVIGLPILMIIPFIGESRIQKSNIANWQLIVTLFVVIGMAFVGFYVYTDVLQAGTFRFQPFERLTFVFDHFNIALSGIYGFLLSPGKGVFWHSPVLLLALIGPVFVSNNMKSDTLWPLVLLGVFVIVYALVRGELWFGGTNWGPRYLLPVITLAMISLSPVIDRCFCVNRSIRIYYALLLLSFIGFIVQIGAIWVNPLSYYDILDSTGIPGASWTVALWTTYFSPIIGHWRLLLNGVLPDFAWIHYQLSGPDWIFPILVTLIVSCFGLILGRINKYGVSILASRSYVFLVVFCSVFIFFFGLRRIYYDQRYKGNNDALHEMRLDIENTSLPDPVIFLNNRTYFDYMLNYYKGDDIWYTLELNPDELISDNEVFPDTRVNPLDLLNKNSWSPVDYFGRQHATMILVMETGEYHLNTIRSMEWWMNSEFHAIQKRTYAENVRTVSFSGIAAPNRETTPEFRLDAFVGDEILLTGYDADPPPGLVRPGNILNLSIQWQALKNVGGRYTVGTYLMSPKGVIEAQNDSEPVGGFWPTNRWKAGDLIRHNVAFVLPNDLPPGHYALWTVMYLTGDGARLPVSDATATTIRDHVELYSIEVARTGIGIY